MYHVIYFKSYPKLCYSVTCTYVSLKIGVAKEESNT